MGVLPRIGSVRVHPVLYGDLNMPDEDKPSESRIRLDVVFDQLKREDQTMFYCLVRDGDEPWVSVRISYPDDQDYATTAQKLCTMIRDAGYNEIRLFQHHDLVAELVGEGWSVLIGHTVMGGYFRVFQPCRTADAVSVYEQELTAMFEVLDTHLNYDNDGNRITEVDDV